MSKNQIKILIIKQTITRYWRELVSTVKLLWLPTVVASLMIIGQLNLTIRDMKASIINVAQASEVTNLSIRDQICSATNGENCDVIFNLCKAESGCQKWAINKNRNSTYDYSYFQINQIHIKGFNKKATIDMECTYSLPCVSKFVNQKI